MREQRHSVHVVTSSSPSSGADKGENEGSSAGTPTQLNPIQRKKKPKRRSTGVVNLEIEEIDLKSEDSGDENVPAGQSTQELKRSNLKPQNGEIDYKKLWEDSQAENSKLKTEMSSIRTDLDSTRHQLEAAIQASTKNSISDSEKREKKISEMEEELKTLEQLRADNQRLRDENGALIRVISKLSKKVTILSF